MSVSVRMMTSLSHGLTVGDQSGKMGKTRAVAATADERGRWQNNSGFPYMRCENVYKTILCIVYKTYSYDKNKRIHMIKTCKGKILSNLGHGFPRCEERERGEGVRRGCKGDFTCIRDVAFLFRLYLQCFISLKSNKYLTERQ